MKLWINGDGAPGDLKLAALTPEGDDIAISGYERVVVHFVAGSKFPVAEVRGADGSVVTYELAGVTWAPEIKVAPRPVPKRGSPPA